MDHYEKLYELLTQMQAELKIVKKSVNKARKDSLMISSGSKETQFFSVSYQNGRRVRKLINGNAERIYRLANRAYEKELARRFSRNLDLVSDAADKMMPVTINAMLKDLPKHFDKLDPFYIQYPEMVGKSTYYPNPSRDEWPREARLTTGHLTPLEWAAMPYCENTAHLEHKIHRTAKGVYCRSKSEVSLLGCYDKLMIPYHTDELVRIGNDLVSPDVTGARMDGTLIYHEHWGLSGDPAYVDHNIWKLSVYTAAGIVLGKNLIITCDDENGAIDMNLAEMQIRSIYGL